MKTTVEIPDGLLKEARSIASREGSTLKALIQEGLRRVLGERRKKSGFQLRRATFKGQGLQPSAADASWEKIRALTYEGRGA